MEMLQYCWNFNAFGGRSLCCQGSRTHRPEPERRRRVVAFTFRRAAASAAVLIVSGRQFGDLASLASVAGHAAATPSQPSGASGPRPWAVAAWNQHRKSSYLQKDCVWIGRLGAMGHGKHEINEAVQSLSVEYSPAEIQRWVSDYDAVAVQEADPLFCNALGDELQGQLIRGANDRDGRGVEVESVASLLLPPNAGLRSVKQQGALLRFRPRAGVTVSRELQAVLVERPEDGQRLVICSVHFHMPESLERARLKYVEYLRPLQKAVEAVAGLSKSKELRTSCLLLGDFNVDPEDFRRRTQADAFWRQFQPMVPEGGNTAHGSNPCARGDFALVAGGGQWQGRSLGSPDFDSFERHAARISQTASQRMKLHTALQSCLQRRQESSRGSQPEAQELDTERRLRQELRSAASTPLRRSLMNSDHRPLHFVGVLPTTKEAS
ncbi:unnamed protein product [Polarella glacialis]|uniref:Endonuclease/exonuclease/phosphatase domain-containing protein n=1 Tax=Polarella glacialis TaxID=89957 RepID=A0A813EVH8_POLGL|nr:unnamed protein product [Polarella glacialis]CAE8687364.1 unnamed protein product [Polarella glacialis]